MPKETTTTACDENLRYVLLGSVAPAIRCQEVEAAARALAELMSTVSEAEADFMLASWSLWARPDQQPPETGSWRTWLLLGGRGSGKTRAGAEWVRAQAMLHRAAGVSAPRIALVGETLAQARAVMVEGVSGLLAVHPVRDRPLFEASRQQLFWRNGAVAQLFSAEDPDSLRGPQFTAAWCDEIAKWRHAERTWDMLQFALRLGTDPRAVVTSTPRPMALLKRLLEEPGTVISRSRTADNAAFLAQGFLAEMEARYGGTALGRQELDGEIIEERADALWRRDWLEAARVRSAPDLVRIVVAVDPSVTSGASADECGIVVAGLSAERRGYVLSDRSVKALQPIEWARAAVIAYHHFRADRIVAETNQGGELIELVIGQVDNSVPVKRVHARRGKYLRAEPVAALYAQGRVAHVGTFAKLEDQMCDMTLDGLQSGKSPDRLDALVWALTELMLDGGLGRPSIRAL